MIHGKMETKFIRVSSFIFIIILIIHAIMAYRVLKRDYVLIL
jgi:succinate dehydrogenase hydrophobic anchor subunit